MDGSGHDFLLAADKAFWLDNLHESLHFCNLAIRIFQQQGNSEGLVIALQNRSLINRELFYLGDFWNRARASRLDASTSLVIVEKNNFRFLYGLSCFQLAESEMLLRNYEEAIVYFEHALLSFHHTGVLSQKGHYCFRLGEALYTINDPRRKHHAREMMLHGISQLHADISTFPYVAWLLLHDHMALAQILRREHRSVESRRHVEEAEKILTIYPELLISRRKYERLREQLGDC